MKKRALLSLKDENRNCLVRKYRNLCLYKSVPIELNVLFFEDKNMIDLSLNFEEPEGAVAKQKFSIKICCETGKQIFPSKEAAEDSYTRACHFTMRQMLVKSFNDILPVWSLTSEPFFDSFVDKVLCRALVYFHW